MTIEELNVENSITKRIPQYIRQYEGFTKFIKLLTNYILGSVNVGENIINLMNLDNTTGDVLVKIANKLDVTINKNYNSAGEPDLNTYYKGLKIAIFGEQTKRLSDGSLIDLKNSLKTTIPNISNIVIQDNQDMTVNIQIEGDLADIDKDIINNYILPKVTGVRFIVQYILYEKDLFAFDSDESIRNKEGNTVFAKDVNGNDTNMFVLFDANGNAIPDSESPYYYNNQRVKAAHYGKLGWDKGEWTEITT